MNNKLNDLEPKEWLKFQKSWFVHNPPPRGKDKILHPATFPEGLAREFIEFFTKEGQVVLDPMMGTGSALVAANAARREVVGVELNKAYFDIAKSQLPDANNLFNMDVREFLKGYGGEDYFADYVITSPPYWDMLRMKGNENQKKRSDQNLDTYYSNDERDFGNISSYPEFLAELTFLYVDLKKVIVPGGYLTIIVKNIKKKGTIYPLAWDLARYLSAHYEMKDEKIWCQDNQKLFPYGIGSAWVSNTFHHYCLNFRKSI